MSEKLNHFFNEEVEPFMELRLSDAQFEEFQKVLKTGIYKELYHKKMLTVNQLNHLLNRSSFE